MLTPSRKPAAKAIARKSLKKLADDCLSDKQTQGYIILKIGRDIRTEMKKLSGSQSILCSQSADELRNFRYDIIHDELQQKAPYLLSFFMAATQTRTYRHNRIAVVCTCAMIILKYRFKRLSLFQKLISLVL